MEPIPFVMVRDAIAQLIQRFSLHKSKKVVKVETLRDDDTCLRVELKYHDYLGEVLVEDAMFAPYRYVSFQIIGMKNGVPDLIYYWYDHDGMSIEETVDGLSDAYTIAGFISPYFMY